MSRVHHWKINHLGGVQLYSDPDFPLLYNPLTPSEMTQLCNIYHNEFEGPYSTFRGFALELDPDAEFNFGCVTFTVGQFRTLVTQYRKEEWKVPIPWYEREGKIDPNMVLVSQVDDGYQQKMELAFQRTDDGNWFMIFLKNNEEGGTRVCSLYPVRTWGQKTPSFKQVLDVMRKNSFLLGCWEIKGETA